MSHHCNGVTGDSPHIEYVTISESDPGESVPISTATTTLSDDVFVEGPLDMPGATVEIVETDPHPVSTPQEKKSKKGPPVYREQLLLRSVKGGSLYNQLVLNTVTSFNHFV